MISSIQRDLACARSKLAAPGSALLPEFGRARARRGGRRASIALDRRREASRSQGVPSSRSCRGHNSPRAQATSDLRTILPPRARAGRSRGPRGRASRRPWREERSEPWDPGDSRFHRLSGVRGAQNREKSRFLKEIALRRGFDKIIASRQPKRQTTRTPPPQLPTTDSGQESTSGKETGPPAARNKNCHRTKPATRVTLT